MEVEICLYLNWYSLGLLCLAFAVGAYVGAYASHYRYACTEDHYWRVRDVPCDNPSLISFGGFADATFIKKKSFFEIDDEQYKKHGRICGMYFGHSPMLLLSEPELLRLIFVKDFHAFADRRTVTKDSISGNMLPALEGEDWKRMRNIVSPIFTSGKMRRLVNLINQSAESLTQSLVKSAESNSNVELKRMFGAFSLDVIASTAFGTELDSINNPDNLFATYASNILNFSLNWRILFIVLAPQLFMKLKMRLLNTKATDFFTDIVLKIKEQRLKEGKTREDFLQLLLDAEKESNVEEHDDDNSHYDSGDAKLKPQKNIKKTLSPDELVAQCIVFFLAGYDTVGTTLSLIAYNLALNPDCQEILLKEIDDTWEKQGKMDFDVVKSMKYLDAVVAESLRLFPSAARLERKCLQKYKLGDTDITIPKGMYVGVPVYSMHHDPEFFPDPETFNPERFLPENKDNIKPYTYLPFGSGPRNCVGMRFALMEVKLCIVHVLRRVTFHTCPQTKIPPEFRPGSALIQPKEVTLKVEKRSQ